MRKARKDSKLRELESQRATERKDMNVDVPACPRCNACRAAAAASEHDPAGSQQCGMSHVVHVVRTAHRDRAELTGQSFHDPWSMSSRALPCLIAFAHARIVCAHDSRLSTPDPRLPTVASLPAARSC